LKRVPSLAAALGAALLLVAAPVRADDAQQLEARTLFSAGNQHLQDGDYVGALDLFRAAYARYPGARILINIGTTLRQLGRYAEAADAYEAYLHDPAAEPAKKAELTKVLGELDTRVAKLKVTVEGGAAQVRVDGKLVAKPGAVVIVRVDPGPHVISADREGSVLTSKNVTAAAGAQLLVELRAAPPGSSDAPPPPSSIPVVGAPAPPRDAAAPPPKTMSHAWQLGAIARADVDGQRAGVVPAVGLSFGLGDYVEINTEALIGRSKGVEPGVTGFILRGAWKPRVSVGVPMFFMSGVHPGVRGAAGVQWDPLRNLGVFLELGAAAFPGAPAGYDKVVFVPSLGLQPRIF
jgi:hypothetical protein